MKNIRQLFGIFAIVLLEIVSLFYPTISLAGNLTTVKDTLQSSRMSFSGRVAAPTIAGSSHVWIATSASGNYTSITTAGLKPGDTLAIGAGTSYVIDSIIDADEFTITTTLATGDADLNDAIIYKAIPQHVISFVTNSAVNGGFFQVLIPAAASGSNDNLPDITGFDFNTGTAGTASNIGNYTFTTPVATASGTGTCTAPANYHCIEYHYTGTGGVGTTITLNIGTTGGANGLIAPAPSSGGRTAGVADTYSFIVKNFTNGSNPSSDTPTDDASGKIAVVEPVRVTATVDPSISFTIEGTTAGTHCSLTTNVPTTATAVPFGILTLNTFRTAAQKLTVSTNAVTGYAVTVVQNERLSNLATVPSYIPNTTCDAGSCSTTVSGAWATAAAHPGFGYTVAIVSGTPTINPTGLLYEQFPNASGTPSQIMSNATTANAQAIDVCYKIAVDATQPAGNYENQLTYTATASF